MGKIRLVTTLLAVFAINAAAARSPAQPTTEAEPVMATAALVDGRAPLRGTGYTVAPRTQVRDFMGRFEVESDLGPIQAVGVEELSERLAELPAARRIQSLERSELFGKALANSVRATGGAVVRVVTRPAETLTALPAGIGRSLVSASRRLVGAANSVGDAARRERRNPAVADAPGEDEGQAEAADAKGEPVTDFAKELAGVNKARRDIAKDLGIDPYTRNPLLAERLEQLAWAAVAGGLSVDLALSAVPRGARDALGTVSQVDQLAWDLAPADIRRQLERRLKERGHTGFDAREFLRNPAFSPSDQLRFVEALQALGSYRGEAEVLALATGVPGPRHARFLQRQLDALVKENAGCALAAIEVDGALAWAVCVDSSVLLPLPVDHLAWTAPLAEALQSASEDGATRHRLLVTGSSSELARTRLRALGWQVERARRN